MVVVLLAGVVHRMPEKPEPPPELPVMVMFPALVDWIVGALPKLTPLDVPVPVPSIEIAPGVLPPLVTMFRLPAAGPLQTPVRPLLVEVPEIEMLLPPLARMETAEPEFQVVSTTPSASVPAVPVIPMLPMPVVETVMPPVEPRCTPMAALLTVVMALLPASVMLPAPAVLMVAVEVLSNHNAPASVPVVPSVMLPVVTMVPAALVPMSTGAAPWNRTP